jgi:hypothetical protein
VLEEGKVSKVELARALRLDPSAVSRKIAGKRGWKLPEVHLLLRYLARRIGREVTYEELFDPELAKTRKGAA